MPRHRAIGLSHTIACLAFALPQPLLAREPATETKQQPSTLAPTTDAAAEMPIDELFERIRGGWSFSADEIARAETRFRAASTEHPGESRWKIALAILPRYKSDAAASIEALKALDKATPKNAEILYQLGQSTMGTITSDAGLMKMAGIAGDAADFWKSALKADANHVMARYALAQYELQARKQGGMLFGSYKAAKKHAETLLTITRDDGKFWGHAALAGIAAAQEEWADMERNFAKAKELAPRPDLRRMILVNHANALLRDKKDPAAARALVEEYITLAEAKDTTGYFLRGNILKETGDCPGAIRDFLAVIERDAAAQNSRFLLAECYEQSGDKASALTHYNEYLTRFPEGRRAGDAKSALKRLAKS